MSECGLGIRTEIVSMTPTSVMGKPSRGNGLRDTEDSRRSGGESRRRGNRWARNRGGTYAGVEMQCDIDVLR